MPLITAAVRGDLHAAMAAEVRDAARALGRGVARAGREVQAELRAQARSAGLSDRGRAVANAWRLSLRGGSVSRYSVSVPISGSPAG